MGSSTPWAPQSLSIVEIAGHHNVVVSSLRLYFSEISPYYQERFFGYRPEEAKTEAKGELDGHITETELRSSLAILACLEATFRTDYDYRCQKKLKDSLSRAFRNIYKNRKNRIGLEDEIFETWKEERPEFSQLVGELRAAFKLRHWLAHGRYWHPKLGRKYDFVSIYNLADAVFTNLPFQS
jgi:hypothetical protein